MTIIKIAVYISGPKHLVLDFGNQDFSYYELSYDELSYDELSDNEFNQAEFGFAISVTIKALIQG